MRKHRRLLQERQPEQTWPAQSTIHQAFMAAGLAPSQSRRRRAGAPWQPAGVVVAPNELWTVDFKGEFRLGNGELCYPLTVQDYANRFPLCCHGLDGPTQADSQAVFTRLFRERGLPQGLLSDNGVRFASSELAGLSRLSVWWLKLGLGLYRRRPGQPQDNPRH